MRLIAGFIGGIAAWVLVGKTLGAGGGVVPVTLIGIAGGNFLASVADAAMGAMRGPTANVNVRSD